MASFAPAKPLKDLAYSVSLDAYELDYPDRTLNQALAVKELI